MKRTSILRSDAFCESMDALLEAHQRWALAADPRNDERERAAEIHCADALCAASEALIATIDSFVCLELARRVEARVAHEDDERLRTALGVTE